MAVDEKRMHELIGKMINDMGAAASGSLVVVGDRLGLFQALAKGPANSQDLADRTETTERYVREWASAMAASGFISYDADSQKFSLSPEQAMIFADEDSPLYMVGGFYGIASMYNDEPKITHAFKTGEGVSWGDHHPCLFCGTEKFFRPGYRNNLVSDWLPALDGVVGKLEAGAEVADIGCGHGVSTIIMAQAFPKSRFIGFDFHEPSVECANAQAKEAGVHNVTFQAAAAKTYHGNSYDLICFFDCLHDMGDPVGACEHAIKALKPDGTMMLVEPFAGDSLEENLTPVGRTFYSFSTMVCTPASLSQEVGLGLGAQAGEKRLHQVCKEAGFSRFRRATETAFNLVLEAKP